MHASSRSFAVIMAGGAGTRFWPRSRHQRPKQLLAINGRRSLLQDTVARVSPPLPLARVIVVTAAQQAPAVRRQLPRLPAANVISEPAGRSTAACIALAAHAVMARDPRGLMAVLPADHVIGERQRFHRCLGLALAVAAREDCLVTIGVPATRAETGYGYIRVGAPLRGCRGRAAWVAEFVEKPNPRRAASFVASGSYLWNCGIFAWRAATILEHIERLLPEVARPLAAALRRGGRSVLARAYRRFPSVSIDHGVLEKASRVAVVRGDFPWSDVGSWAAMEELWRRGAPDGANAVRGKALGVDSFGCVVDSPGRLVALVGVRDLIVVDSPDALLVCDKHRAQDVRRVVEELRRRRWRRYL